VNECTQNPNFQKSWVSLVGNLRLS
jgi:hypothetical protein